MQVAEALDDDSSPSMFARRAIYLPYAIGSSNGSVKSVQTSRAKLVRSVFKSA